VRSGGAAVLLGLCFGAVAPAWAQPQPPVSPRAALAGLDAEGAVFTVSWSAVTGATSYRYEAGYHDVSLGTRRGAAPGSPLSVRLPYHPSGGAVEGFVCLRSVNAIGQVSASQACASLPVPVRPATLPPPRTVTLSWTEPTTNVDGTPLRDLARTIVVYQADGGLETEGAAVPASSPTGGGTHTVTLTVPTGTRAVTVRVYAEDTEGNRSPATAPLSKTFDDPASPRRP
jgi:hypothetical protein